MRSVVLCLAFFFLVACVSAAGDMQSQARLALRETRTILAAVDRYKFDHTMPPPNLQALVPGYLDYLPVSPWGWPYRYWIAGPNSYDVAVKLPAQLCGAYTIDFGPGDQWRSYPRCVLTDEERHVVARKELQSVATACREYAINHNQYPGNIELLAPYLSYIPRIDPWGNYYDYDLSSTGYILTSFGADGAVGGCGFDLDTLFSNFPPYKRTLNYGTTREYVVDAFPRIRVLIVGCWEYAVDNNRFPEDLDELFPTYIADPSTKYDLFGNEIIYHHPTPLPDTFTLIAAGKDGVEGTDDYEVVGNEQEQITTGADLLRLAGSAGTGVFDGGLLPACSAASK